MNIYEKLRNIQRELKVPKEHFNNFGKYKYRTTEDILEGVKPLLAEMCCIVTLTDIVDQIGDRYYVKATATITSFDMGCVSVTAYAREEESKKGMDACQVSGTASSYARKYALNGLFAIDDTQDSDTSNTGNTPVNATATPITSKVGNTPVNAKLPQLTEIETLREKKGVSQDALNEWIATSFGKKHIKYLTEREALIVIDAITKKEDKSS